MKQAITVVTWSGGREPCTDLLNSLTGVEYPVVVVINDATHVDMDWVEEIKLQGYQVILEPEDRFECGAIRHMMEDTDYDEFALLQDTIIIKNKAFFHEWFVTHAGRSVWYSPYFQMYIAKFTRKTLEKISIPVTKTKAESVKQEADFTQEYRRVAEQDAIIWNLDFVDGRYYGNYEQRYGRRNLKMEDSWLIKYKGTWDASMLVATSAVEVK